MGYRHMDDGQSNSLVETEKGQIFQDQENILDFCELCMLEKKHQSQQVVYNLLME